MNDTPQQRFHELLSHFDHAMLVTRAADGQLRSRPMAIAEVEPDSDLWFVTGSESGKVAEIESDPQVNVALQSGRRFLSISGRASVVEDRARLDQLWNDAWRTWFPQGKDDPDIVLLRIASAEGEYWDNAGLNGLKYLFQAGKARLTGDTPDPDPRQHQSVKL